MIRPDSRHPVDFPIRIAMHDASGAMRQITGRCTDLSSAGAQMETRDPLPVRSTVMISSTEHGRMGHASVRYCRRVAMKYVIGVQFNVQLRLADPARNKILTNAQATTDRCK